MWLLNRYALLSAEAENQINDLDLEGKNQINIDTYMNVSLDSVDSNKRIDSRK